MLTNVEKVGMRINISIMQDLTGFGYIFVGNTGIFVEDISKRQIRLLYYEGIHSHS